MKKNLRMAAAMAAMAAMAAADAGGLTIAKRGTAPDCEIVCGDNASPSQKFAAEEFRAFTKRMTGVELPVVKTRTAGKAAVVVVDGDPGLGSDGFSLKVVDGALEIRGGRERGTLYGAYEVLERFGGCRWYSSSAEVVPETKTFSVPDDLADAQKPAFDIREVFLGGWWGDKAADDCSIRNKLNGDYINKRGRDEAHGGNPFRYGAGLMVHTFYALGINHNVYFKAHPEYFHEVDGKRTFWIGPEQGSNPCFTNPDVEKIATSNLLEAIRRDPTAPVYGVSQNDWPFYCSCAKCKPINDAEGSPMGTMLPFVNRLAASVEKEFPGKWIDTIAYQFSQNPPKTVRAASNVVIRACSIDCEYASPYRARACEKNREWADGLVKWHEISNKLFVWDYVTSFGAPGPLFPNVNALQDNVKFFRDCGVSGVFEQGAGGAFYELRGWLLSKWLWNPDRDMEGLLDDFFPGFYGEAAPAVRKFFDKMHSYYKDPVRFPLDAYTRAGNPAIPDSAIAEMARLLEKAKKAVKDDPAALARVLELANDVKVEQDTRLAATWRDKPEAERSKTLVVEDSRAILHRRGAECAVEGNVDAKNICCIKVAGVSTNFCVEIPFDGIAFRRGAKYAVKARVLAVPAEGASAEARAFSAKISDSKGIAASLDVPFAKVTSKPDKFDWYTVAEGWTPSAGQSFWFGTGRDGSEKIPAAKQLLLDRIEITEE